MQKTSGIFYIISLGIINSRTKSSGEIYIRKEEKSDILEDIEYLEKIFKKWKPNMLSSPYIPTPSLLIKLGEESFNPTTPEPSKKNNKNKKATEAKSKKNKPNKKYEEVIDFLHKGAYAYSIGDYGTAINYFTRLLEMDWLKYSSYFYLVKTLIKLDIEKEVLSLRANGQSNNVKMIKTT